MRFHSKVQTRKFVSRRKFDTAWCLILIIFNFSPKLSNLFIDFLFGEIFFLYSLVSIHEGLIKTDRQAFTQAVLLMSVFEKKENF